MVCMGYHISHRTKLAINLEISIMHRIFSVNTLTSWLIMSMILWNLTLVLISTFTVLIIMLG